MGLLIGVIIGLVLGLTGAGGSIFAVPLLILLLGLPVTQATGVALGAVSISAIYGTINNWRYRSILWIPAILLTLLGSLFAPLGRLLGGLVAPEVLLLGFNLLAIIIALRMWQQANANPTQTHVLRAGELTPDNFVEPVCRLSKSGQFEWKPRCVGSLLIGGIVVGLLTGLFGVGGGFFIVPLILFLSQVSTQQAVGTSLFVISIVSAAGFASYALNSPAMDWTLLALLAVGGMAGMFIGNRIGHRIAGPALQKIFAAGLVIIALSTLLFHFIST